MWMMPSLLPVGTVSRMRERNQLENSDVVLFTHEKGQCFDEVCSIHNRTDHAMRSFPQHWRGDRRIMERICPHGVGHPDPDDSRVMSHESERVHGCDGCCDPSSSLYQLNYGGHNDNNQGG